MPGSLSLKIDEFNADFAFANNPIVVKATNLDFNGLFRKVIFEVNTYYEHLESNKRTFIFEVSAEGLSYTDTVRCDISSCLRSAFAQYEYNPEDITESSLLTYPGVRFGVKAWLRDFYNGVIEDGPSSEASGVLSDGSSTTIFSAFLGGLSEMERWTGDSDVNGYPIPLSFSTKPSGEILCWGQILVRTWYDAETGNVTSSFSVNNQFMDARERISILFVNSRGVYETISVLGNESEEYEVVSEEMLKTGIAEYRPSATIFMHKTGGAATWKMSSGYVNKEWAQWYTREFLMANHYWLRKDSRWLPVAISADGNSVATYDKNDPSLVSVDFIVKSAIKG